MRNVIADGTDFLQNFSMQPEIKSSLNDGKIENPMIKLGLCRYLSSFTHNFMKIFQNEIGFLS